MQPIISSKPRQQDARQAPTPTKHPRVRHVPRLVIKPTRPYSLDHPHQAGEAMPTPARAAQNPGAITKVAELRRDGSNTRLDHVACGIVNAYSHLIEGETHEATSRTWRVNGRRGRVARVASRRRRTARKGSAEDHRPMRRWHDHGRRHARRLGEPVDRRPATWSSY